MKNIPEVVLTNVSNRIDYYQWFLYGFMLMEKKGKIILKYRTSMTQRMLMSNLFWPLAKLINKLRFIVMKRLGKYDPKRFHQFSPGCCTEMRKTDPYWE